MKVSSWRRHHFDPILTKSLTNRIKLAAAVTFEWYDIESCTALYFVLNELCLLTEKWLSTTHHNVIICFYQLFRPKSSIFGENCYDVLITSQGPQIWPDVCTTFYVSLFKLCYKVFGSISARTMSFSSTVKTLE